MPYRKSSERTAFRDPSDAICIEFASTSMAFVLVRSSQSYVCSLSKSVVVIGSVKVNLAYGLIYSRIVMCHFYDQCKYVHSKP